jgi:transcriptional regulator with XRE-family HTH domain
MRKELRDFFKTERQRLGLNQTAVADRAGLTQGMVSRIEIEPDYEPTVEVFEKAVTGLGLTLSSFFARIEALQSQTSSTDNLIPPEPSGRGVSDERPSPVRLPRDPDSMGAAMAVIKYLTSELIRTRADAEMRRSAPSHRPDAPDRPRSRVSRTPRDRGHAPGKKNRRKR